MVLYLLSRVRFPKVELIRLQTFIPESEDDFNYGYIQFSVNSESHINRSESVQLFGSAARSVGVQRGRRVCSEF